MHADQAQGELKPANPDAALPGFDPEFTDIVDYILRITERIWEGRQVGLCRRYYSDDCPVWTLAGTSFGAEAILHNTLGTLATFPDRTLHAENIVWGGNAADGFHTSHLIKSNMTHLGPGDLGPATRKQASIAVIAHCVVRDNRIVEEWLVRDNFALLEQLGIDPAAHARALAAPTKPPSEAYTAWRQREIERVCQAPGAPATASTDEAPAQAVAAALHNIWNARLIGDCRTLYTADARIHASGRPDVDGIEAIMRFYVDMLAALPDAGFSADYICDNSMRDGSWVAVRWTLAGLHTGPSRWGAPTGAPVLVLGESQYRLVNGRVVEEWLVFDEVAVMTQIERARNAAQQAQALSGEAGS
ncbi:MAG: ester cyclase [Chromatocurvus sp.]